MDSGGTKSDAPAVLAPEPEVFASAVGNVEEAGAGAGKEGEVSISVSAPGVVGVDYLPFAPALQLPSVEYQQTGTHRHTSSWPPNRDTPTWLIYASFGSLYTHLLLRYATMPYVRTVRVRVRSARRSGHAGGQRAVRRGGAGARGAGRVRTQLVGRAAMDDRERGGRLRRAARGARRLGGARRVARAERGARAEVLHGGELLVAHVAGERCVPVRGELLELGHHVLRVRHVLARQLHLLPHRL